MLEEHGVLIFGDSFQSKMQSMDDEKAALLTVKRQFLPLQSRIDKQKSHLERISKEIEKKQQTRLEILQKWIEADQELESADSKQSHAKQETVVLVAGQTVEKAKAVNQGIPMVQTQTTGSTSDKAAKQTILSVLSMQNVGCHSVSEQLMAAGATEEDVKKISHIMAQTVKSTPTNTARTELHSMITCHHANTRGQELQGSGLHIFVS